MTISTSESYQPAIVASNSSRLEKNLSLINFCLNKVSPRRWLRRTNDVLLILNDCLMRQSTLKREQTRNYSHWLTWLNEYRNDEVRFWGSIGWQLSGAVPHSRVAGIGRKHHKCRKHSARKTFDKIIKIWPCWLFDGIRCWREHIHNSIQFRSHYSRYPGSSHQVIKQVSSIK